MAGQGPPSGSLDPLVSDDIAIRRLRRQRRTGVAIATISGVAFAATWQLGLFPMSLAAVLGLLTGGVVLAAARRDPGTRAGTAGRVWIEQEVLFVQNAHTQLAVPLEEVAGGWLEEEHDGSTLALTTRRGDEIAARMTEGQQGLARALLSAAGVDGRAVAMTVARTTANTRGCASGCLLATALIALPIVVLSAWDLVLRGWTGLSTFGAVVAALFGIGLVLALRALETTTVTVGSDGVTVTRWGRGRFLPFARLDYVVLAGRELALFADDGELTITCQNGAAAQALKQRLEAARATGGVRSGGLAESNVLARAGRSAVAWREHLSGLLDGVSRYRARALDRSDLWAVLEDAAASPELRAAAAVVLSRGADAQERRRLRVASDSCALRPLRIALEHASEGELELVAIEEAMAAHRATGDEPRRLNGSG